MTDLRKAAEMALDALEEINKLSVGEKAICLPAEIDDAMEALRQALSNEFNPDWNQVEALQESLREHMAEIQRLRQALAQPKQELVAYVPGFYCGEKISLSRIKLGERFVLVRTGQIYSKTKDGYWNEAEQRPARLHLNCQVQLIKEKNA